ncbi:oxidoreductase domain-containing protein [Planococcus donghaensis MPA1U2]|uniref:Oxidoreductase domain-containing protein n=1 Tax=Planococcus donghaensis MPA1U2 TaxID=933115 RepID=E7RD34_9BACL|nr:Gfo/Idh/MocA family oxidoreductase [Planococcus donghaensis]EGA91098.1 oxidoreductase domain-containing protein [Planococcus donghaensis MPA1U2]
MKRLNWGIIGPGNIAEDFGKAIHDVNGHVFGVWGRNYEKTKAFAERLGVEHVYESMDSMLSDEQIDIVYIATPHHLHYDIMLATLYKNKHVLCEKAITMNTSQLKQVMKLARSKNLIVMEAMTIYHMPIYQELQDRVAAGDIGNVNMINVTFGSCKEDDPTNRFFNPDLAGGGLLDLGTYALTFTRYFLSSHPTELFTTVKKHDTGVDEQSAIVMKNKQGQLAVVTLALRADLPIRAIIAGDKGYITVDNFPRADQATVTYTSDGAIETIKAGESERALRYEVEAMEDLGVHKKESWTLALSENVMELMDEARKQWDLTYDFE